MANFVFNIAKGRVTEFYNRVDTNDPANSALIMVAAVAGSTDAALMDMTTLSAVLAATPEATNSGYARKVLTDVELAAFTVDNVNDRIDLDLSDQTWTAVLAGTSWARLYICYDNDTTSGTDANIIPLTSHDFVVTPDGSDIIAQINNFYRAA